MDFMKTMKPIPLWFQHRMDRNVSLRGQAVSNGHKKNWCLLFIRMVKVFALFPLILTYLRALLCAFIGKRSKRLFLVAKAAGEHKIKGREKKKCSFYVVKRKSFEWGSTIMCIIIRKRSWRSVKQIISYDPFARLKWRHRVKSLEPA